MTFAFRLLVVALAIAVVTASVPVRAAELVSGAETRRAFSVKVVGSGHRPMILIPGLLSAGEVWESVVAHFAPSYRIHVLTVAGFADVPALAELDDGLSVINRVRDDLIAYIHEAGLEKPVLVGHSLGAMLAMWAATAEPAAIGPIVAVDGVPFASALMNPRAVATDIVGQAEQLRSLYRTLTPEQLERQTRMALPTMVTAAAHAATLAEWARRSDPAATGQVLYELMTTDLRPTVGRIESDLLVVAAGKAFASSPNGLTMVKRAYEAQVAAVPRHRVVVAERALHFVMLDDPVFLLNAMDEFLGGSARR
jgi:pimeloyl-ACP methyl ester carboxylesterase